MSISVDHDGTWHHLRLLTIALTAMLLGSRYFRTKRDITILLVTLMANGAVMSLFGIVHSLTTNGKMFLVFIKLLWAASPSVRLSIEITHVATY